MFSTANNVLFSSCNISDYRSLTFREKIAMMQCHEKRLHERKHYKMFAPQMYEKEVSSSHRNNLEEEVTSQSESLVRAAVLNAHKQL